MPIIMSWCFREVDLISHEQQDLQILNTHENQMAKPWTQQEA